MPTALDGPVRAITFDFWNTVMFEPEGGLESARVDRWEQLLTEVERALAASRHRRRARGCRHRPAEGVARERAVRHHRRD